MKFILALFAVTLSMQVFAGKKVCHNKNNEYAKSEEICDNKQCGKDMVCKEIASTSKILGAVAGVGEKSDTDCKDVVQFQAQKDAAAKLKAEKEAAGTR